MDASEQKLIADLFARMRGMQGIAKDPDAAALIQRESAANPDAAYLLTQSVLVQEQALQNAQARITELEGQVSALERAPAAPTANAGFMSGAVPSVGAAGRGRPMGVPASAMAANDASDASTGRGRGGEAPVGQSRGGQSGGFMAQAMTTAAGVAGGMLLASGISSLFGSSNAEAASGGATETAAATPAAEAEKPAETASNDQQAAEEDSLQQASHDDSADDDSWGGFDDFGDFGDLDI